MHRFSFHMVLYLSWDKNRSTGEVVTRSNLQRSGTGSQGVEYVILEIVAPPGEVDQWHVLLSYSVAVAISLTREVVILLVEPPLGPP